MIQAKQNTRFRLNIIRFSFHQVFGTLSSSHNPFPLLKCVSLFFPISMSSIITFFGWQGSRSQVYNSFEAGFALYLKGEASLEEYNELIQSVTTQFSMISRNIIECNKHTLEPYHSFIAQIQLLEKQHLELTVEYQELQIESTFGTRDYSDDCKSLKKKINGLRNDIGLLLEELHCECANDQNLPLNR
jgi:hypothetical protein